MPSRVFTLASLPRLVAAAVQAAVEVARKSSWRIIRAQPTRAILLATATAATLRSLLASSLTSREQGDDSVGQALHGFIENIGQLPDPLIQLKQGPPRSA